MAAVGRIRFSVSHTTRSPRGAERDGVEYHFVDRARFEKLIAQERFLEWAQVHGELYGTSRDEVERAREEGVDLLLDVDVQGAAQVRERVPDVLSVFILPPSYSVLEQRLRGRAQDDEASIARRLEGARGEMEQAAVFDYMIVNDDVDDAVAVLEGVIRAARARRSRMAAQIDGIRATFA
jgi:guanylate kinase